MGAQSSKFSEGIRCPVADPSHPYHTLSHGVGRNPPNGCFYCSEQQTNPLFFKTEFHYRCITCNVEFHDKCHECPSKIQHLYHSQHPLILTFRTETTISHRCDWCRGDLGEKFYRCYCCGFSLDLSCVKQSPNPMINDPKSHHHPLLFFPWPFSLPCDACGLVRISEPVYTCFQCNYMVHQSCTNLPRVIKITRHRHRLTYTPFSQTRDSTCQICYKTIDIMYGYYSCYQDGCLYTAHSLCATDKNVGDKNELEWEPEEVNEDVEPFKKVGVDLIKYFCHEHHLRLQGYDVARDAGKQCEACILHIDSRDFYHCTQCDFYLHEVCANLPQRIDHALHRHPLLLKPSPTDEPPDCSTCNRWFTGFRYECSQDDNIKCKFNVDIQCILVPDCFTHTSHEHPLFISTSSRSTKEDIFCKGYCESKIYGASHIQCTLCTFALCYHCATIPKELYYKHDQHSLSLCHGEEEVDDTYWCEICEKVIDSAKWFYSCIRCCITIHHECIFGSSAYAKPGYIISLPTQKLEVVCNNSNTRPICFHCEKYCPDSIYLRLPKKSFCSKDCLMNTMTMEFVLSNTAEV